MSTPSRAFVSGADISEFEQQRSNVENVKAYDEVAGLANKALMGWALVAPFMPAPRRIGRPRTTDLPEVVKAILCIATTGCGWAMPPKDCPPRATVQRHFHDWRDGGLPQTIRFALAM